MSESTTRTSGTFEVDGKRLEFPRVRATEGNDGLSVSNLLSETGVVTLDPGFMNTANCTSAITYIDGDAGILRYRGYPIEQLAERSTFLEVAYLLIHGELPSREELTAFESRIARHTLLHEDFKEFFTAFPRTGHPMAVLQSSVAALGTFYPHTVGDVKDPEQLELATVLLLAKIPTVVAYIAKRASGLPLLYPNSRFGYIEDFLRMTFGIPYEVQDVDPDLVEALEMLLILHADHEQNCSTSVVRVTGSSQANLYASVAAGVGALSGPLHGGANESVLAMLEEIRDDGGDVDRFVDRVKNRESGVRLMGFGHRVYKNYDPRAAIVKKSADRVLSKRGGDDLLDIALRLEEIALSDDYFVERKLYPNVDFYTGLIYKAMGFPEKMFTPLFALGRLPGWIAQYREMIDDPQTKIGRPRQVYTGHTKRDYVPMGER